MRRVTRVRAVTVVALLRPTVRAMAWTPFVLAMVLGAVIAAVPAMADRAGVHLERADVTTVLRAAALCAGLGTAFLLDDPAATTTSTVPTPRVLRLAVRLAVAVPVLAAWWAGASWTAAAGAGAEVVPGWLLRGLTVEAAAVVAVAFGLASAALRRLPDGGAGVVAAPALLVLAVAATVLPSRVPVVAAPGGRPGDGAWDTSHRWWWALVAAAVVALLWTSRDLTARRISRPVRS